MRTQDEARKKFQTYLFFLRHFDRLMRHARDDSTPECLLEAIMNDQRPRLAGVVRRDLSPASTDAVRKLLFNGWNSETVARINSVFEVDVRAITNQWKPIQVYYALYFLLSAVHAIHDPRRRHAHEPTLRFASSTIGAYFPAPWSCYFDFDHQTYRGFPWPQPPAAVSGWNLANHDDPHVFVAHFYRTTAAEKRHERWVDHGKGRKHPRGHPKAGRRILISDVRGGTVSIWDVLWRMRKWVNYQEAEAVLAGQDFTPHIEEFDGTLNTLLTASAEVIEHLLCGLLGQELMTSMYDDYYKVIAGKVDCSALMLRRGVLTGIPF